MKKKRVVIIVLIIVAVIGIGIGGFYVYSSIQLNKIPLMTFDEMLDYTTEDNEDAVIAVGIINNGEVDIKYYGENGALLEGDGYEFEIGSITKTFTTSLLCKLIDEGKMDLDDNIDNYIDLPQKDYYPSIERLVTHTSGYKGYYLNKQMRKNFFGKEDNYYYGISTDTLIDKVGEVNVENKEYSFVYSNFGMAVLGETIAQCLNDDYSSVMDDYIKNELKLNNTRISDGTGNLDNYWNWCENGAYVPAGAIISTIDDMMEYLSIHMESKLPYLDDGHQIITRINATKDEYAKLDIRLDAMGIGWVIDTENDIVWHDGGTSNYNSYIGFDMDKQVGVVILSNLSPSYRIPVTVMGAELLISLQDDSE